MKFKKTSLSKLTLLTIFIITSSMLLLLVISSKALAAGIYGNAVAADLLSGKTATSDSGSITGTMPNKVGSGTIITPTTVDQTILKGYYGGATSDGKVKGDSNLIGSNILSGKSIFGVAGTLVDGTGKTNYAAGTATPTTTTLTITGLSFQPTVITAWWYYDFAFTHFTWSTQIVAYQGRNALYTIDNQPGQFMQGTATPNASGFTITAPTTFINQSVYWAAWK